MAEPEYTDWRNLIGDFIMEFARVEDELDHLICDAFPNEYEALSSKMFKPRATFVIDNIEQIITDNKLSKNTKRVLNELMKLADNVRNMIAHYPLEMSLERVFSDNPAEEIRSRRNINKAVTFSDLEANYKDLLHWSNGLKEVGYSISCTLYP